MPNSLKLGLICVLLLSACGSAAAQVTVGGVPTTTSPSTAAGRSSDDKNDTYAFHQLDQFVEAADDAGWTNVQSLTVPGLTLLTADQPSGGPDTISLALLGGRDFAVAILSQSGTCLWYALLDGESRFGTGEPCTAAAAIAGSSATLPGGSTWRRLLDNVAAESQARAAQSALRNSLVAAKTFYADAGNFKGFSPEALHAIEPTLDFVGAGEPSTAPDIISVAVVGDQFGAASMDANGTCYWIAENVGLSRTQYGQGTPCTGTAAFAAGASTWKTAG